MIITMITMVGVKCETEWFGSTNFSLVSYDKNEYICNA